MEEIFFNLRSEGDDGRRHNGGSGGYPTGAVAGIQWWRVLKGDERRHCGFSLGGGEGFFRSAPSASKGNFSAFPFEAQFRRRIHNGQNALCSPPVAAPLTPTASQTL